ncbi:MAG: CDP-diacylglycerol--serine O-phosphatidyltransferase [Thermodesulfobacteriota bacterium]|nr:CDP-diacylglycerol--serine O-phosphatidyltransferase [Thermodesulfobacteriota bacterium]
MIRKKKINKDGMKKGIYVLPNLFTTVSLLSGFYAIISVIDGRFQHAACAILVSLLFDGIDGRVARLTRSTSPFGVEYDSLSDLVAFGIAPGLLAFSWALVPFGRFGWLAAFLYVACGALRLARYNVQVGTIRSGKFNGLPIPAAASMISSTILLFLYLGYDESTKHITILVMIYILSFLMVSNIKYSSFKELGLLRRKSFSFLVTLILLLMVVVAKPQIMLFTLFLSYVLSGPITTVFHRRRKVIEEFSEEET